MGKPAPYKAPATVARRGLNGGLPERRFRCFRVFGATNVLASYNQVRLWRVTFLNN
jgi:hypothetical protein